MAVHPAGLVTVTLYVAGLALVIPAVVAPVLHRYVPPPLAVRLDGVPLPPQPDTTVTDAAGLERVTVPLPVAEHPAALVTVTV